MIILTVAASGAALGGMISLASGDNSGGGVVFGMMWTAAVAVVGLLAVYKLTGGV